MLIGILQTNNPMIGIILAIHHIKEVIVDGGIIIIAIIITMDGETIMDGVLITIVTIIIITMDGEIIVMVGEMITDGEQTITTIMVGVIQIISITITIMVGEQTMVQTIMIIMDGEIFFKIQ